jgi:hypothetical protein
LGQFWEYAWPLGWQGFVLIQYKMAQVAHGGGMKTGGLSMQMRMAFSRTKACCETVCRPFL